MGELTASSMSGLPEDTAAMAQADSAAAGAGHGSPTIHVVKPGETLYRIGRRYGVKLETLRKWNKLPDDIIEVGQKLIVGQE
jgi:LysM repeat protein